jgi:hypothetical protein
LLRESRTPFVTPCAMHQCPAAQKPCPRLDRMRASRLEHMVHPNATVGHDASGVERQRKIDRIVRETASMAAETIRDSRSPAPRLLALTAGAPCFEELPDIEHTQFQFFLYTRDCAARESVMIFNRTTRDPEL